MFRKLKTKIFMKDGTEYKTTFLIDDYVGGLIDSKENLLKRVREELDANNKIYLELTDGTKIEVKNIERMEPDNSGKIGF